VSAEIRPFRAEVPDAVLADLRERLARTRLPDQLDGYYSDSLVVTVALRNRT